jgi:hypothetical protein
MPPKRAAKKTPSPILRRPFKPPWDAALPAEDTEQGGWCSYCTVGTAVLLGGACTAVVVVQVRGLVRMPGSLPAWFSPCGLDAWGCHLRTS